MSRTILLPGPDGTLSTHRVGEPGDYPRRADPPRTRTVYAAAHVVADPRVCSASEPAVLDLEATLAFRHHLWDLGMAVAEAMDTAQRGMGLDWPAARDLIARTGAEAKGRGARWCAGAQTDHLAPGSARTLNEVIGAYREQCEAVEQAGATVVVMASRELCRLAKGPEDYAAVYSAVLQQLSRPAILHWLGEAFDPALAGYWGSGSYEVAAEAFLGIVAEHAARIEGVKCSLLEQRKEVELRSRLPIGVAMYTGDDFDYPTTIAGDGTHHSDALLGAFDFAAPAAAHACAALDAGDLAGFHERIAPSLPLARHVFSAPTSFYKTGVVFLAYLNGFQAHFKMVGGLESGRSLVHLAECFRLADAAGLLSDPDLAIARMRGLLATSGLA
ncbi:MAG: dihydrodipicolinate synthase family protein [Actinomycetota bacterium]|nr:dihydrodipicolinate synthase family protein [Actinomycetota bacterium]